MSKRETIEFGYTDQYGNKRVFKTVDVTDMTEADIRYIKNEVYKEMYASLTSNNDQHAYEEDEYVEDFGAPQCGCNGCTGTVPKLESEVRALRRELDNLAQAWSKSERQVEALKELLKEAWNNGN